MGEETVTAIVKRFQEALTALDVEVEQLILFGSHVTGTARADSDIDLVVISASFADMGYWERIDILSEAIYQVFAPIDATAFTPEEWHSGQSLLVDYVQQSLGANMDPIVTERDLTQKNTIHSPRLTNSALASEFVVDLVA